MASGSASYLISSFQELKIMPGNDYNSWNTWGSDSKLMMDLCEVEEGIEYTISAFVKKEGVTAGDIEGTFYILRDEPADETNLASFAITSFDVIATTDDTWKQVSFSFTVDGTFGFPQERVDDNTSDILTSIDQNFVIFYFVQNAQNGDNEVFLTDIVITTPGF